jgi:hypothetical protein
VAVLWRHATGCLSEHNSHPGSKTSVPLECKSLHYLDPEQQLAPVSTTGPHPDGFSLPACYHHTSRPTIVFPSYWRLIASTLTVALLVISSESSTIINMPPEMIKVANSLVTAAIHCQLKQANAAVPSAACRLKSPQQSLLCS